ncbi:MAG: hypothetical protein HYY04_07690 [Chloroflexi bacterium]|nr:hypothetical protein [Chloroflexota bacterium]
MTEQPTPSSATPPPTSGRTDEAPVEVPEPAREIRVAPDERLNVAYDPHFSHATEVREALLQQLARESQRGGRAHCSRCERVAVRFIPLRTPLGLFVVAACEQCGAWFLM